jgi:hypothetical protein
MMLVNRNIDPFPVIQGKLLFILTISLFILIVSCSEDDEYPQYNPPGDHTISQDGVMHKPGLNDPLSNCITCHGADLRGGTSQVSCFECHGEEW